jgi:RNase P subunit RPR2
MPKGQWGCYRCGHPSAFVLQAWYRDYLNERDTRGNRRQVTLDSAARHYCKACTPLVWTGALARLPRATTRAYGCRRCHTQSTGSRIQLWLRDRTGHSVTSATSSYCQDCADIVYGDILQQLGGEWAANSGYVPPPENLAAARARYAAIRS